MIVEYVCDGSHKGNMFGAGVVKVFGKSFQTFHFNQNLKEKNVFVCHEIFSIYKTLELIEEHKTKNAIIYNDDSGLLNSFKKGKSSNRFRLLTKKLNALYALGYNIEIKHVNNLKNKDYYKTSHKLSREYMKLSSFEADFNFFTKKAKKSNNKVVSIQPKENGKSKPVNSTKQLTFLHYNFYSSEEVFKSNKTMLKELYPKNTIQEFENKLLVSESELSQMDDFVIQRINNRYWGVFSKNEQLLFVSSSNILDVSVFFFSSLKKVNKNKIAVNGHFISCLKGSFNGLDGSHVTEAERSDGLNKCRKLFSLMENFSISTFKDFYFANK